MESTRSWQCRGLRTSFCRFLVEQMVSTSVRCAMPLRAEGARIWGYWLTLTRSLQEPHLPCLSIRICHFILVSGASIVCSFHLRLTSLHIRLEDITRSITIVMLAPYCLSTPPFQVPFATVQRSLRSDAPPQIPSCSLPTLVDAAHTRHSLPSTNIDGFHMLPVSSNYYCSLFLARFLFLFWHPQFLTSQLPPVLSPFAFYVFFHPLPLTCSPSLFCAPACAFTYTLI